MTSQVSMQAAPGFVLPRGGPRPTGGVDPDPADAGPVSALQSPAHTLARADELLEQVCERLEAQWRERSPEPPDVLSDDFPQLLRDWLLPTAGKRLRPVMCHWGWAAAHGPDRAGADDLVATCAALELVHLFALVHDDVMDRSDARRGRVTVHVEAAKAHAGAGALGDPVLFGDLALSEAWGLVGGVGGDLRRAWTSMLRELVQGQLFDVTGAAGR